MAARRNCRFYPRLYEAAHGCGRLKAFRLYSLSSSTIRLASKRRIQVRVLLVDDDAAIARSIELMLKVEEILPIRLTQTPARCRVRPRAGIKVGIGRRVNAARDAEQRAERVERVKTPVEAERELIEVGLQMLGAHAVVDAVEPGLQIGEHEVDHRHELFGNFGVAAFGDCMVVVAPLA